MKILHVIASTDPRGGGPVEGLKQFARVFEDRGHLIEVASLDDPSSPWLKQLPVRVHALGPGVGMYSYSPKLLTWLAERGGDYDRIVVNGIWQFQGHAVWTTRHQHKRPYFVFAHGMLDPYFRRRYPLKHVKKQVYWLASQYRVLRDASAVLFTCEEERRLAQDAFWPYNFREKVVRYGTGGPRGDLEKQAAAFRAKTPEIGDKPYLMFMSRIHPKKGCDVAIKAFAAAYREDSDTQLLMAGPDQVGWKKELEALAKSLGIAHRIHWPGMVEGSMKWGALAGSEAMILPSHQENFGIVVAEALACSRPALISNSVNIWREVVEAGAGFACGDNEIETTQMLLQWRHTSRDQREEMGINARNCFLDRFESGAAGDALLEIYRHPELIERRHDHGKRLVVSPR